MSLRTGTVLILIAIVAVIAYQVVNRLSSEAISVAVGVLFGMVASVPVSLGLLIALTRQRDREEDEFREEDPPAMRYGERRPYEPARPQPPVIVIAPPAQGAQAAQGYSPYTLPGQGASYREYYAPQGDDVIEARNWKIIGEDA